MLKREIQEKYVTAMPIMRYNGLLRTMMLLIIGFSITGCGQAGGLYLVNSEAEYNEGHFILPYRGEDQVSNGLNDQNVNNVTAQAIIENEEVLDEENALLSNDESI